MVNEPVAGVPRQDPMPKVSWAGDPKQSSAFTEQLTQQ
jgi:hypothetical protein